MKIINKTTETKNRRKKSFWLLKANADYIEKEAEKSDKASISSVVNKLISDAIKQESEK